MSMRANTSALESLICLLRLPRSRATSRRRNDRSAVMVMRVISEAEPLPIGGQKRDEANESEPHRDRPFVQRLNVRQGLCGKARQDSSNCCGVLVNRFVICEQTWLWRAACRQLRSGPFEIRRPRLTRLSNAIIGSLLAARSAGTALAEERDKRAGPSPPGRSAKSSAVTPKQQALPSVAAAATPGSARGKCRRADSRPRCAGPRQDVGAPGAVRDADRETPGAAARRVDAITL